MCFSRSTSISIGYKRVSLILTQINVKQISGALQCKYTLAEIPWVKLVQPAVSEPTTFLVGRGKETERCQGVYFPSDDRTGLSYRINNANYMAQK